MSKITCPNCHAEIRLPFAPLTARQAELFKYIEAYIRVHGHAPTFAAMAVELRIESLATVHEHLNNLQRKGVIRRGPGYTNITLLVRSDELGEPPTTAEASADATGDAGSEDAERADETPS
jgi:SOS-response transcriptional repressor LexA